MRSRTFHNGVFPAPVAELKSARPLSDASMHLNFRTLLYAAQSLYTM